MAPPTASAAPARDASRQRAPDATPQARPDLRVVRPETRRLSGRAGRSVVALAVAIALGSLLVIVAAQAYLVQGQERLAALQSQVTQRQNQRAEQELLVAKAENPATIVRTARRDGLVSPTQVSDLPPAGSSPTATTPTTATSTTASTATTTAPGVGRATTTPTTTADHRTPTSTTATTTASTTRSTTATTQVTTRATTGGGTPGTSPGPGAGGTTATTVRATHAP